jgi:hypothetical protein
MILFQHLARICGAGGENRTPNLLITNQLPYHWATPAMKHTYTLASREGHDPPTPVLETGMLPITPPRYLVLRVGVEPTRRDYLS